MRTLPAAHGQRGEGLIDLVAEHGRGGPQPAQVALHGQDTQ